MSSFQQTLFPPPPPLRSSEPTIWFRRIVLLRQIEPEPVEIRAIPLHRGLNVVRTDVPTSSDLKPVGHDVGKTMFTRLMRYCLGEPNFCDQPTKTAVSRAYPDSYVAAELVVGGDNWSVLRPMGAAHTFETKSGRVANWTELFADPELTGINPLVEAISNAVLASTIRPHLRLAHRPVRWLDILQWIARDQRCHSTNALEWRDADTESGNPRLQLEDAAIVLKTATGLLSDQERTLIEAHNDLLTKKHDIDAKVEEAKQDLKAEERFINREFTQGLRSAPTDEQPMVIAERVNSKIKSLQSLLADVSGMFQIPALEGAQLDAVRTNADISRQVETKRSEKELLEAQLAPVTADQTQSIPNLLYERCSLDADTCPVKKAAVKVGLPLPLREDRNEEIRKRVDFLSTELLALQRQVDDAKTAEVSATQRLTLARARARRHEAAINRQIARLRRLTRLSNTRDERAMNLEGLAKMSARLDREQKESLDAQSKVRESLEVEQLWLNGQFDKIIKHLVGSEFTGRVRIDSKAVRLFGTSEHSSSGEAVRASTLVWGLDLACFAATVEGHGFLPRLLILDSPRESDIESTIYGRLFGFFRELAGSQAEPNFQVILTTTTPPPPNTIDDAAIILNLNRRGDGEDTLLRKIF